MMSRVLVTSAGGMTGRAVVSRLTAAGFRVRAVVRTDRARPVLEHMGADVLVGDLGDAATRGTALTGVDAAYLIWPNFHPDELEVLASLIRESTGRLQRIVYHSVFRPHVEAMPHHWVKARVEEVLYTAPTPFTILQPCAYLDNMVPQFPSVAAGRGYRCTWSPESRLSLVAVDDVAEVAARILPGSGHDGATYELCGPQALSAHDVCGELSRVAGVPVVPVGRTRGQDLAGETYSQQCFRAMSEYYDAFGLTGSARVLGSLLGRPATSLAKYLAAAWPAGSQG